MKIQHIPFLETGYFSILMNDYLSKNSKLSGFYDNFPDFDGFENQIKSKSNFEFEKRIVLSETLKKQNKSVALSETSKQHIDALLLKNTFTVTTGHQLNIFTGPLYFLYKIITTVNLTEKLNQQFPQFNFVPIYWMASEDHDFEEINFFNFKEHKINWNHESGGPVGRLKLDGFEEVFKTFSKLLGTSDNANYLKELFNNTYLKHNNLSDATRFLVNELFGDYGLVILDGDDTDLKKQFSSIVKDELLNQTSFKETKITNSRLNKNYDLQVNPREMNLFYMKDAIRERIIFENDRYLVNNTNLVFSEDEILQELENFPERFSPNVIMRPLYQETILPNLCYVGGGGELAYWFQLKGYFKKLKTPFPILLLRNSVLLVSEKQQKKLEKLDISISEIFWSQEKLIEEKVRKISKINIDFSKQKRYLEQQFIELKELAKKTDASFLGAVNAQEKKQLNGLANLEKRLLKAQKRKLHESVERIKTIQNELFPNQSLEERTKNFSEFYLKLGNDFIPLLKNNLNPLALKFTILQY